MTPCYHSTDGNVVICSPTKSHYRKFNRRAIGYMDRFDRFLLAKQRCRSRVSCGRGNGESTPMELCRVVEYFADYYGWTWIVKYVCPCCHRRKEVLWYSE
jgi:hypothetical protein